MPESSRDRLFLIDGYSNIFRAFYAIRGLTNSKGMPTNAVYGFLQMLRKLLREEDPELIGVALDLGEPTIRSERYEEYKAHRKPMPEELRPQIPWIRRVLEGYRIPILEIEEYEADDVLGTVARRAAEEGYEVILVSSDKDLMQLVDERVSLYHTGRDRLYGPEEVEEEMGVPPERVADVLALTGDSVDNIPGVTGIGKKGAPQLVREFGSLEEVLSRVDEVSRKSYREGLHEEAEQARLSKELVTIHTDVDVDFDPEDLRRDPRRPEDLRTIFAELEFFSLLEELVEETAPEEVEAAVELMSPDEVASRFAGERILAFPVGAEGRSGAAGIALTSFDGAEGSDDPASVEVAARPVHWIDFQRQGMRDALLPVLEELAASSDRTLVGHDVKELIRLLERPGGTCCGIEDSMLYAFLVNPALKGYSLADVALETLHVKALSLEDGGWQDGERPPPGHERLLALAGERVRLVERLHREVRPRLVDEGLDTLYEEIEAPLAPILVAMEERGILVDVEMLEAMSEQLGVDLERLESEIYKIAGEEFNLNSPMQLREILFDKLDYPVIKRTRKTKSPSTDAESLEELADRGYPLPELLLGYREVAKLKGTYVDALPGLVAPDGRIHTRFHQTGAATGRLSSSDPNLQNIPVRGAAGRQIRRAFVAPQGSVLLVADYSQVELRVLAHIAEEEAMIEAFEEGRDIHAATASRVFGVEPDEVSAEQRRAAKVINFGIIYGMSAYGLAKTLKIEPAEAATFIEAYMERYPGVKRYTEETLAEAEERGRVETLYARIRPLPELMSSNHAVRENARRMAINARIQGTAADLMKLAMVRVHRRLAAEHPEAHLLLTVHDELVLEAPLEGVESVASAVRGEMEGVADLAVPLAVEAGWGPSWSEAAEAKTKV